MNLTQYAILMPAYNPDQAILETTESLLNLGIDNIFVINDGSDDQFQETFSKLSNKIKLLKHATNLGKGAALKYGFNYIVTEFPQIKRIITVDADGQHLPDDILKVIKHSEMATSDSLVLGVRNFEVMAKKIPFRSHIGNLATKKLTRLLTGIKVSDSQTGLRSIPCEMVKYLLPLKSNRYDFEFDMLLQSKNHGIKIEEVPITTVYIEDNKSSHFNPLIDSMKIYFVLFRFIGSSLLTALIDYTLFFLVHSFYESILLAQIIARILAGGFNYNFNKNAVFKSKNKSKNTLLFYILLVVINGTSSYAIIEAFRHWSNTNVLMAKFLSETILYLTSFVIQRDFIFNKKMRILK